MKRFLTIFILSILFTSNAYAKIDKSYVKQIYEGCISDAKQNNDYNSNSKKFCKCYVNEFDKKFTNEQLIEFLSKSDQAKAQIIQNEISPPCYPTSNSSQKSTGVPADAIRLICSTDDKTKSFEVLLIPSTKEGINMGAYGSDIEELQINDTYYQLSGLFIEGKAKYHLRINRSTGRYRSIWDGGDDSRIQVGSCEKKKENKF